ncbi:MAG: hypothetical protein R3E70_15530 [Burkholderiaceae bacterium]
MGRIAAATTLSLGCMLAATPALAALPTGTLSFVQRTGTVLANETIEVRLELTMDSALDFSSDPLAGFAAEDLPTEGGYWDNEASEWVIAEFVEITGAYLNTWFTCQGSVYLVLHQRATVRLRLPHVERARISSINFGNFTLLASDSYEYTFGFFSPTGGRPPDTYKWNGTRGDADLRQRRRVQQRKYNRRSRHRQPLNGMDDGNAFMRTVIAYLSLAAMR